MEGEWRRCGPCKKMIAYAKPYYLCSVATCRKQVFCSQACWQAHVPMMRHKDAWPEEALAPVKALAAVRSQAQQDSEQEGKEQEDKDFGKLIRKRVVHMPDSTLAPLSKNSGSDPSSQAGEGPRDILIVASKLKNYIKETSQLNTSAGVMDKLSEIVRRLCDDAIAAAKKDGRKTVMERDFSV